MRKIVSSLILTAIIGLSVVALSAPKISTAQEESTMVWTCSVPGITPEEGFTSKDACDNVCEDEEGISGICTQTIILTPAHIISLINKYTQWFVTIVGAIAVIMIIIGGLQLMLARGNEEKVGTARKMILWALIGLAIVLLAGGAIWTIGKFLTTT